jgi:hypothetical protein
MARGHKGKGGFMVKGAGEHHKKGRHHKGGRKRHGGKRHRK